MLPAAAVLAVALTLLAFVPSRLAAASWPARGPVPALVLWQAVGLAGGLLTVELALTVALAPFGPDHASAVQALASAGALPPWWSVAAGVVGTGVLLRLLQVLLRCAVRTLRERRRLRQLLDLVGTRNPLVRGAHVVEHELPLAYCLPGLRPRVVLSQGALLALSGAEVEAVLAHEQAHVDQRHDLVVLPFVALLATLPRLRPVRTASEQVALLVELLADDSASRRHDRTTLARALYKVASGGTPAGGLAVADRDVLVRAGRLLGPPDPLPRLAVGLAGAAAVLVAALPLVGLLLPLA